MLLKSSFIHSKLPLGLLYNAAAYDKWRKPSTTALTFRNINIFLEASKIFCVLAHDIVWMENKSIRMVTFSWIEWSMMGM